VAARSASNSRAARRPGGKLATGQPPARTTSKKGDGRERLPTETDAGGMPMQPLEAGAYGRDEIAFPPPEKRRRSSLRSRRGRSGSLTVWFLVQHLHGRSLQVAGTLVFSSATGPRQTPTCPLTTGARCPGDTGKSTANTVSTPFGMERRPGMYSQDNSGLAPSDVDVTRRVPARLFCQAGRLRGRPCKSRDEE